MLAKNDSTQTIADALCLAEAETSPIRPIREILAEGDIEAAYAVQEANTDRALRTGRRLIGRKIGLTSKAVQRQLGVDQPDFGMLFADMEVENGGEVPRGRLIAPKVEAEVAFVIGRDLTSPQPTAADVMRAVEFVLPALEIVDSRIANWDIRIVDTVADNASSGRFVLGSVPRRLEGLDLRLAGMVLEHNGEPASTGAGAACLGNPLIALQWLARKMAEVGRPLQEGDVVLSGALGPMVPAAPASFFQARISGLGSVAASFPPA